MKAFYCKSMHVVATLCSRCNHGLKYVAACGNCRGACQKVLNISNTLPLKRIRPQNHVKCTKWHKNSDFRVLSKRQRHYVVVPTKNGLFITHIPLRNTPPCSHGSSCSAYHRLFSNSATCSSFCPMRNVQEMHCGIHRLPRPWEFTLN